MGIRPNFSQQQLHQVMLDRLAWMDNAIMSRFIYVGETFVNNARRNGDYKDQTGNLRSSICYVVFKDAKKVSPGPIAQKTKKLIQELKQKYSKGYVLIVATGMNYAAAVESKGKDVITGSSTQAKIDLNIALRNLKRGR